MQHVMIDFETLDTAVTGAILSIGAVRFDLDTDAIDDNGFYTAISPDSNFAAKRTVSESTLHWWMQEEQAAARAVFNEPKDTLKTALTDFCHWFGDAKYVWSNGVDFDVAMMAHALKSFDMETPWDFWDTRCARTYKNLPGMKNVKVENPFKHNALQDAITQAKLMQAIQKKLKLGHPMVKGATV